MEEDADLQFLLSGGDLLKIRSNSWKKHRFYKLNEDCKTMWYKSHKTLRPSNPTFSVDDIAAVRLGRQTEGLRKNTDDKVEGQAFSIMFKSRRKNLDLIASSEEEAKQWVAGLEKIISHMSKLNPHWIFNSMCKADKNCDNKMSLKELKSFLQDINIEIDDEYAQELFEKCDHSQGGYLEGEEIEHFYKILTEREEIDVIYTTYAKTNGFMSAENLLEFLQKEQREPASLSDALILIDKYELDAKEKKLMTKDGFLMYLHQMEGLIFNPAHKGVHQDMTQPLSHYFISSSHNTYLLEDQLKGPSSTEAYVRALMKSCRCVELDCWDGSDGEPVIYHGYTLTSKILFKDAVQAIKDYAFKTSEYPVILSLECHCSVDQQKVMAQHMIAILGSALVTKPLGDQMPKDFPSPEELKGRFLIKGKRLNKLEDCFTPDASAIEDDDVTEEEESGGEESQEERKEEKPKDKKLKLAKELSDIVIYCKSVHFHGFEDAAARSFYEMSSFKESTAMNLAQDSANKYIQHNVEKLSRVYPAGTRTDSSNYNPVPLWNGGCQMVALNFQTPGLEMDLNQGCFLSNGKSGYILKPAYLMDKDTEFDPVTLTRGGWLKPKTFHVMVISAQQLPKLSKKSTSIVDPLVKVQVFGVPDDVAAKETDYIENNGILSVLVNNDTCTLCFVQVTQSVGKIAEYAHSLSPLGFSPMWNANFQFHVCVPELALVRFLVEDYDSMTDNDFIGQYTLPFTSLQNGQMGPKHPPTTTSPKHPRNVW
uniref:Phosphoinositide phospholipase C n=1 Tax=Denticeps clupeoides TaxID=299321 RepID=A0AAY4A9W4_9TELE